MTPGGAETSRETTKSPEEKQTLSFEPLKEEVFKSAVSRAHAEIDRIAKQVAEKIKTDPLTSKKEDQDKKIAALNTQIEKIKTQVKTYLENLYANYKKEIAQFASLGEAISVQTRNALGLRNVISTVRSVTAEQKDVGEVYGNISNSEVKRVEYMTSKHQIELKEKIFNSQIDGKRAQLKAIQENARKTPYNNASALPKIEMPKYDSEEVKNTEKWMQKAKAAFNFDQEVSTYGLQGSETAIRQMVAMFKTCGILEKIEPPPSLASNLLNMQGLVGQLAGSLTGVASKVGGKAEQITKEKAAAMQKQVLGKLYEQMPVSQKYQNVYGKNVVEVFKHIPKFFEEMSTQMEEVKKALNLNVDVKKNSIHFLTKFGAMMGIDLVKNNAINPQVMFQYIYTNDPAKRKTDLATFAQYYKVENEVQLLQAQKLHGGVQKEELTILLAQNEKDMAQDRLNQYEWKESDALYHKNKSIMASIDLKLSSIVQGSSAYEKILEIDKNGELLSIDAPFKGTDFESTVKAKLQTMFPGSKNENFRNAYVKYLKEVKNAHNLPMLEAQSKLAGVTFKLENGELKYIPAPLPDAVKNEVVKQTVEMMEGGMMGMFKKMFKPLLDQLKAVFSKINIPGLGNVLGGLLGELDDKDATQLDYVQEATRKFFGEPAKKKAFQMIFQGVTITKEDVAGEKIKGMSVPQKYSKLTFDITGDLDVLSGFFKSVDNVRKGDNGETKDESIDEYKHFTSLVAKASPMLTAIDGMPGANGMKLTLRDIMFLSKIPKDDGTDRKTAYTNKTATFYTEQLKYITSPTEFRNRLNALRVGADFSKQQYEVRPSVLNGKSIDDLLGIMKDMGTGFSESKIREKWTSVYADITTAKSADEFIANCTAFAEGDGLKKLISSKVMNTALVVVVDKMFADDLKEFKPSNYQKIKSGVSEPMFKLVQGGIVEKFKILNLPGLTAENITLTGAAGSECVQIAIGTSMIKINESGENRFQAIYKKEEKKSETTITDSNADIFEAVSKILKHAPPAPKKEPKKEKPE